MQIFNNDGLSQSTAHTDTQERRRQPDMIVRSRTRVSTSHLGGVKKRAAAIVATLGKRRRGPGPRATRAESPDWEPYRSRKENTCPHVMTINNEENRREEACALSDFSRLAYFPRFLAFTRPTSALRHSRNSPDYI